MSWEKSILTKDSICTTKLSIVIVAYKSGKVLLRCLDSIEANNDLDQALEVVVVDNSPEGEKIQDYVNKSKLKNVQYFPSENKGFGAGNNLGAKNVHGDIIAFINPDIIFVQPIFSAFYQEFQRDKDLILAGGKLIQEDGKNNLSFYYDYGGTVIKKMMTKVRNGLNLFDAEKMYISGADMFVRKAVFFQAGMFDERIFMYYEEPDLIRRMKRVHKGGRIKYFKKYKMIHLEKKSTPNSLFALKHELDSSLYYGKKYGLNYKKRFKFEYNYRKIKRIVYSFLNKEKKEEMEKAINYIRDHYEQYI